MATFQNWLDLGNEDGMFFLVNFEDEIDGDNAHFKIGPQIKSAQNQNFIGFREFNFARFFPFSILQKCC